MSVALVPNQSARRGKTWEGEGVVCVAGDTCVFGVCRFQFSFQATIPFFTPLHRHDSAVSARNALLGTKNAFGWQI